MIKRIKHKQTIGPWKCSHCHLIWYGHSYEGSNKTRAIVPVGYVLCHKCYNTLEKCIANNHRILYNKFWDDYTDEHVDIHKQIYTISKKWIDESSPCKKQYKGVPHWMRSAIEQGKVIPNTLDAYVVTEENKVAINVEIIKKG